MLPLSWVGAARENAAMSGMMEVESPEYSCPNRAAVEEP
jgi:hypothetical protein